MSDKPATPHTVGDVRVVHVRTPAEDTQGEIVIRVDRANKILGNRHVLRNKYDPAERAKVIAAFRTDLEADIARNGPMSQEVDKIAQMVFDGKDVALACWCKPAFACHGDVIAEKVLFRTIDLVKQQQAAEASTAPTAPAASTLEEAGVSDYCGQVCGGGQCGTGSTCQYGIDPETHMPPAPCSGKARGPSL